MVPKNPRPNISYDEWDGLLRICFVRKNKTLRANFLGTTSILNLLENNYKTYCAQNDIPLDDGPSDTLMDVESIPGTNADKDSWTGFDNGENEEEMDLDDDDDLPAFFKEQSALKLNSNTNPRKKRGKIFEIVREKVRSVLEDKTQLADKRARMCEEGDFLKLLYLFNVEGIHFR
jgi:18S rRNA (adenine1779-N6/adenine1780-N6)-dimethyltransferase